MGFKLQGSLLAKERSASMQVPLCSLTSSLSFRLFRRRLRFGRKPQRHPYRRPRTRVRYPSAVRNSTRLGRSRYFANANRRNGGSVHRFQSSGGVHRRFPCGDLPPNSAIRQIKANQDPFSAEYDRLGYGRVESRQRYLMPLRASPLLEASES